MAESFFSLPLLVQELHVLKAVELGKTLAAVAVGELVEALQRHLGHLEGHQPLGLLVLDVLAALDGEEEVFGEALLLDLLGGFTKDTASEGNDRRYPYARRIPRLSWPTHRASPHGPRDRWSETALPGAGLGARSAIFSTRLIVPTTSRVWALS